MKGVLANSTVVITLQYISVSNTLNLHNVICQLWASQVAEVVKNMPASAADVRGACSVTGSGRTSGGGHGSPLQHSCLENPLDRETWRATVHRVAESDTTEAT